MAAGSQHTSPMPRVDTETHKWAHNGPGKYLGNQITLDTPSSRFSRSSISDLVRLGFRLGCNRHSSVVSSVLEAREKGYPIVFSMSPSWQCLFTCFWEVAVHFVKIFLLMS